MTTESEYLPEQRHAILTPGASLRIVRELQELSQSALARLTGIPQSAISALESGNEELGIKRAKVLAAALQVHPAVIAFPDWRAEVIDILPHIMRRERAPVPEARRRKAATKRRSKARRKTAAATTARPKPRKRRTKKA